MGAELKCEGCKRLKPGRFTRKKTDTNLDLPRWYCWNCLHAGQGRDETEETMPPKPVQDATVLPAGRASQELIQTKSEVMAQLPTIQTEVAQLRVVDAESYIVADGLLGRIRANRSIWGKVWARIQEKSIKPIREGLEELYSLNRDVDVPMEKLEERVKLQMKAYKIEEVRQIQARKDEQLREEARLKREAEEKAAAANRATTAQMRGKLAAASERLAQQAAAVAVEEAPAPVQGSSSGTRPKKKWRIKDMRKFCAAIGDGTLPDDCVAPLNLIMNQYFKDDPVGMAVWPGVEVYDDVQIVGR